MADFKNNPINIRFREVFTELEERKLIKSKSDLANKLNTYNHVINNILKGQRNITVDQLQRLCEYYQVNANYIFGLNDNIFEGEALEDIETMSLDEADNDSLTPNIMMVGETVRGGYAVSHQNPAFLKNLPKFSIPQLSGKSYIAFQVSGDSMMPTITHDDVVVCEPLERDAPIYDNHVYVVVTDVLVVKRVQQIKQGNETIELRLFSDNSKVYQPYAVPTEEIQQLLKVKCRLTSYGVG